VIEPSRTDKRFFLIGIALLICAALWFLIGRASLPGVQWAKRILRGQLVKFEPLPATEGAGPGNPEDRLIYVLGGSPENLARRLIAASDLYRHHVARRILIYDSQILMAYNPEAGRNLTFDEWAIRRLEGLGVNRDDIEPVAVRRGMFGTFSEARDVPRIVSSRSYKSLILVSSRHHTARVWNSFKSFARKEHLNLYIYPADDDPSLRDLLLEYLKLEVYRLLLL